MASKNIKAIMVEAKVPGKQIATQLKVSEAAVSQVVHKKIRSRRIQQAIAEAVGIPYERLWGKAA